MRDISFLLFFKKTLENDEKASKALKLPIILSTAVTSKPVSSYTHTHIHTNHIFKITKLYHYLIIFLLLLNKNCFLPQL